MYNYVFVTKLSFRTSSTDHKGSILEVAEWVDALMVGDFEIGQRCLVFWTPVYNPGSSVEQIVVLELLKRVMHNRNDIVVKCKLQS